MPIDERFQVRNEDVERKLRTIGTIVDGEVPDGWGWALFMVPFGAHEAAPKGLGAVFWISNSERPGMLDAIQGWIDEHKKGGH
jgi:hypothetical protein